MDYLKSRENKVVKRGFKNTKWWQLQLRYFRFSCLLSRTSCKIIIVRQNVIKTCIFLFIFCSLFFQGSVCFCPACCPDRCQLTTTANCFSTASGSPTLSKGQPEEAQISPGKKLKKVRLKGIAKSTTHQSMTAVRISIVIAIGFGPA